jgi:hypothetical protein
VFVGSNNATKESYAGVDAVEFTTARGVAVRGRCITIAEAMRFMALLDRVAEGDGAARVTLLSEFVEAAALGDQRITAAEIFKEVLPHFLSLGGAPASPSPKGTPENPSPSSSSTTGGMT